jgi:hypothetical protein
MEPRDRVTELLIETLARALAVSGEHRLFRSGKLDGLFPSRSGPSAEAADRAMRTGLLERARVETKGRTEIEWVCITPAGVEFLHQHESPVSALHRVQASLHANQEAIPCWLESMQRILQEMQTRLSAEAASWQQRLAGLEQRLADTLRRLEAASPLVPPEVLATHPWTLDALNYLDRRRTCMNSARGEGQADDCPLPELFDAVRAHHPALTLADFREGLLRLHQRRALRLRPAQPPEVVTRPEFALYDELGPYYYAMR